MRIEQQMEFTMGKNKTTYDRFMSDPDRKKDYEKGYKEFLLTEMICEAMEEQNLSVRKLALLAHVSKTTVMQLRTGDAESVTLKKLKKILTALHMELEMTFSQINQPSVI